MRLILAAPFVCLLALPAQAQTIHDDRYFIAWGGMAEDVVGAMRCPPPCIREGVRVRPSKRKRKRIRHHDRSSSLASRSAPVVVAQSVPVPLPAARPVDAPDPDEEQAPVYAVIERLIAEGKVVVQRAALVLPAPDAPVNENLFKGFARELSRALPPSRSERMLSGVIAPLAALARRLVAECGSTVISGVRRTLVRGTRKRSLHWDGKAVDIVGNPRCMYALLKRERWPGGASIDYAAVRHIHLSYAPKGREWGARFAHYRGVRKSRHAKRYGKRRYASR